MVVWPLIHYSWSTLLMNHGHPSESKHKARKEGLGWIFFWVWKRQVPVVRLLFGMESMCVTYFAAFQNHLRKLGRNELQCCCEGLRKGWAMADGLGNLWTNAWQRNPTRRCELQRDHQCTAESHPMAKCIECLLIYVPDGHLSQHYQLQCNHQFLWKGGSVATSLALAPEHAW